MADFTQWLRRQKQLNAGGPLSINEAGNPIPSNGEQTIRLLGPFHIAHDTAGINSAGGYEVGVIPAGALVLEVAVFLTEGWGAPDADAVIEIYDGDLAVTRALFINEAVNNYSSDVGTGTSIPYIDAQSRPAPRFFAAAETTLLVQAHDSLSVSVACTDGEADIYALIAEPAS